MSFRTIVAFLLLLFTAVGTASARCGDGHVFSSQPGSCCGDCDGDGRVTVDEILLLVSIALGLRPPVESCVAGCTCGPISENVCVEVNVDIVISVVDYALNGCVFVSRGGTGEECDDGGICIGGPSAGRSCFGEDECEGSRGVCCGGLLDGTACAADDACSGGRCVKCKPFGGDGCAANCTAETVVTYPLVPGQTSAPRTCVPGTSCSLAYIGLFPIVPVTLSGSIDLVVGAERDGRRPAVVKPFAIPLPDYAFDARCFRGVPRATCGGTLFDADGDASPSCEENDPHAVECPPERPCALPFGPGNAAVGEVGCTGLAGTEVLYEIDCNGVSGAPPGSPRVARSGSGPPGSAFFHASVAFTQYADSVGPGCSVDDPVTGELRFLMPMSTGSTLAALFNPRDFEGDIDYSDGTEEKTQTFGTPLSCTGNGISASGATIIGATAECDRAYIGAIGGDGTLAVKFVGQ